MQQGSTRVSCTMLLQITAAHYGQVASLGTERDARVALCVWGTPATGLGSAIEGAPAHSIEW